MIKIKRVLSVFLCALLISSVTVCALAADTDYTIINPYEDVDFSAVTGYKGDLHSHTTASDGDMTLVESVEEHYRLGYDFLAVSDHGTVSYSWSEKSYDPTMKLLVSFKKGIVPIVTLNKSGTASNGKNYSVETKNGDDYYSQASGKEMLRVPFANEQNPTSFNNAHVNTFFVDYGNGLLGGTSDYATPISAVDSLGGISVINHPGEYSGARDEASSDDAYNKSNAKYSYIINKFENLLLKYPSCLGIDINSKGDNRTRYDRKLWDILLTDLAPHGRNVYAVATSDAHNVGIINSGYIVAFMPENTSEALKEALSSGNFVAQSRYIGNRDELCAYAAALESTAPQISAQMSEVVESIDSGNKKQFSFDENASAAEIGAISVDEENDSVTISGEGMLYVRWISDGRAVAEGNTIYLDECENLGSYIRAEIISEGAVTYTQAFLLEYEAMPEGAGVSDFDMGSAVSFICDTVVRLLSRLSATWDNILRALGIV